MIRYLLVSLFLSSVLCFQGLAANRPNIILILIDDQDNGSIGAFGGDTYTPNLDRMAAEGMKFTQAYVSSAVCTPSRYSFATGRYAGNSYSKRYLEACGGLDQQGHPNFNMALEADRMNIGRVLSDAGYATGWVGKFHIESELDFPEFFKGKNGFRSFPKKGLEDNAETTAIFAHNEKVMRRYIQNLGFDWVKHTYSGNMSAPYNHHNPEWTTEAVLEFIEENKDNPFYLHYCTTLLHGGEGSWRKSMDFPNSSGEGRLKALPDVMTPRDELLEQVKAAGFDPNSQTSGEAWIDDAIGAVLKKLKQLGIDDNTLVLFAPDHGRRGKGSLYSADGLNVPMIARWPAQIASASVNNELIQNVDWVPTVFEAAGVELPKNYQMDGQSFLPILRNEENAKGRDHVYMEMGFARGVATKRWKYIAVRYPQEQIDIIKRASPENLPRALSYIGRLGIGVRGADRPGFWDGDQLYDLNADPEEHTNLASDPKFARQLKTMKQFLKEDLESFGRPFGEFVPGGNAVPGGQIDEQIALVKTLKVQGKTVTIPAAIIEPNPVPLRANREERKAERLKRKEAN
ncbi:MAG: sulfatase-like hydrolase/transferase [Verrucomicrobia bacterium]|nr:sulfatase-like hydrolase/transferase [Verrucomicrobiota bacterium]MDA1068093.1 sulfatase-like hydrolase/transferase [Verrucomicrobiota bacterium]